ncbi:MAG: indolepyruvate ferredoxin oxidoreductase family protein [Ilumatobacteraceae bacterium]
MTDMIEKAQLSDYVLADRYRLENGRVFVSGLQAIARLPLDQLRIDRRNGLDTAAFISGYQGSPVAAFGDEVERAARTVEGLPIVCQPGANEELAATAVMGSQLASTLSDFRYDGVIGMWYGKAPGLDRASDAIRHGVFAGTSQHGGVVAIVGDDPAAKSSTLPSSSDATLVDLHMPIFFPGDVQEALDLSRHAVALSRACGLWAGFKLVSQVADGTGTADIHPERVVPQIPTMIVDGAPFVPHPNGRVMTPYTLDMEREFFEVRSELAREYGVLNRLNRVTVRGDHDWIGIAACGTTYLEVRETLELLGLGDDDAIRAAGIRLFQLLMPVPLEPAQVREFAHGLAEVIVVEEKNPTLERLVRDALYDANERPAVVGRRDDQGRPLIPAGGLLDAERLITPLRARLARRLDERLAPLPTPVAAKPLIPLSVQRAPFFCSGCPHNTSTRVEPGTLVGGGIGCHAMVGLMEPERVGDLVGLTCMGNEGAQWIGMAPFVERNHLVQNLGDGTFFHSGSLAIRAAVAAGIDITYKLLHNGTVAMTGGQDAVGAVGVPDIVRMVLLEGVSKVIVTTDDLDRYDADDFAEGVDVWHRTRIDEAQRVLAATPGTTVLLHDQACAAEKRRARSRGKLAVPDYRVVINERVCEGCGDCGAKSNCLSVQPIETPYGRKTRIHQTSCNFDLSCMEGDCPAFATVSADPAGQQRTGTSTGDVDVSDLPEPAPIVDPSRFTVRLSGIGGTGVVTVSQILGTAAMLAGHTVRGLDQTGLSQKAGPVTSDIRITDGASPASNHASVSGVDALLAFDLLAAASDSHRRGATPDRTVVVASTDAVPTGEIVAHPTTAFPAFDSLRGRIDQVSRSELNRYLDAASITTGLFGGTTTANVFVLGVAAQVGAVPVPTEFLERAIELNGVAVERNIASFRWGRRWAVDPAAVEHAAGLAPPPVETLDALIDRLADDLVGYQSRRYAQRYRDRVSRVRAAEQAVETDSTVLTDAVARNLHKLMAYKDEYEVARLLLLDESRERYESIGGKRTKVTYRLHPPMLRAMGMQRKLKLRRTGPALLKPLRSAKGMRGTLFDPFRWGEVRAVERAMIPEYERAVDQLIDGLTSANLHEAAAIAGLPDQVRGYEHLKLGRAKSYRAELAARMADFTKS